MQELVDDYLRQGRAEGLGDGTVKQYRGRLTRLLQFLRTRGRTEAPEVTPEDLDAHMLDMTERGNKKNSRMSAATTIAQFFRWLLGEGRILTDPARDIAMPDDGELDLPPPPLEEDEVTELFEAVPARNVIDLRNRLHLELLYGCGLRNSEACSLDVRDCDIPNRSVHVRKGKGNKERFQPMLGGVRAALQNYLALRRSMLRGPDHGVLLLGRRGRRVTPSNFRQWLRDFSGKLWSGQRHVLPHLLRHSAAIHLLRNGADIRVVQAFLDHEDLDTTKIYLRLVPGHLKEDYDKAMPTIAVTA